MQTIMGSNAKPAAGGQPAGLTPAQVSESRSRHGDNRLKQVKQQSLFMRFVENFGDPIIRVLLVALGINLIFALGDNGWSETVGIALAILLATWVSTLSMYQSDTAFQKLQEEASRSTCRVLRSGRIQLVPMTDIVVGDHVLLQSGERVPADGEMVQGELDVDQSALNGETKEAHKAPGRSGQQGFAHPSRLFSGSVVCAGDGAMRVTAVGNGTYLGQLAGEIQTETRESPLQLRLAHLAGTISKLGMIGAVLVALADLFNLWVITSGFSIPMMQKLAAMPGFAMGSLLHAVTLAVTVIVVAVPEGLPMMITVVLSANMRRMIKDNVLVRTLVGVETAGNINMLFTDKTGTLTQGKLRVACVMRGDGTRFESAAQAAKDAPYWRLLRASLVHNNAASMVDGAPAGGNMTDRALLDFAFQVPQSGPPIETGKVVPFHSDAKYMATEITGRDHLTLIKGAPELLLPHCARYLDHSGQERPLLSPATIQSAAREMALRSMRTLAVVTSREPANPHGEFRDLVFVALVGVRDPLRPEAKESVEALEGAGIQVVMITGDSRDTAQAIARDAGLLDHPHAQIITSGELAGLSDEALTKMLPELRVVARALPSDKTRLIDIAQNSGAVVGMTGDGVNDSPALKKADIGFAMGSGTEVAKEAGDIVILDDNLSSITTAVLYGRTIFRSVRKFIVFQLTVNVCAVSISIIAPLIGYEAPVTVLQMLWINMVMDTLAGLAFSGEPALRRYLKNKPLRRTEPIITREMGGQIAVMGIFTTCLCIWFLLSPRMHSFFRPAEGERILLTAFFAVFMYAGIFNSVSARTESLNLLDHILGNKAFVFVMALVFLVQTCLIYVGGDLMRTYGLTFGEWMVCIALAALVIPVDLIRKLIRKTAPSMMGRRRSNRAVDRS